MSPHESSMTAQMSNPWFAVSMGLLGVIVGYSIGTLAHAPLTGSLPTNPQVAAQPPAAPSAPAEPTNFTPPTVDDDPIEGSDSAKVTLIEFTDFQCPFCERHFKETYGQIKKDYVDTGKIKYVIRDYPLSFHPNAQPAAEAAGCAQDQGKYFEMHDKLFSGNAIWSSLPDAVPTFKQYAADLGLNTSTFNTCLDSHKYKDEIAKDTADGTASGINGTPGFWIIGADGTGTPINGAMPYATFKQVIDQKLGA